MAAIPHPWHREGRKRNKEIPLKKPKQTTKLNQNNPKQPSKRGVINSESYICL